MPLATSELQPPPHRRHRHPDQLGDLRLLQTLDVAQDVDGAVLDPQLIDQPVEVDDHLAGLGVHLGRDRQCELLVGHGSQPASDAAAPNFLLRAPDRNGHHKGSK
jgi:hypothetical protein